MRFAIIAVTVVLMAVGAIIFPTGLNSLNQTFEEVYFVPIVIGILCLASFPAYMAVSVAKNNKNFPKRESIVVISIIVIFCILAGVSGVLGWAILKNNNILRVSQPQAPPFIKEYTFTIDKQPETPVLVSVDVSDSTYSTYGCPSVASACINITVMRDSLPINGWFFNESSTECHSSTHNPDEAETYWVTVEGSWRYTIVIPKTGDAYTLKIDMQAGDSMFLSVVYDDPERQLGVQYEILAAFSGLGILLSMVVGPWILIGLDIRRKKREQ